MNRKADLDALRLAKLDDLGNGMLRPRSGHSVPDNNDDRFGTLDVLDDFLDIRLGDAALYLPLGTCRCNAAEEAAPSEGCFERGLRAYTLVIDRFMPLHMIWRKA
jgi:hypothetical protein